MVIWVPQAVLHVLPLPMRQQWSRFASGPPAGGSVGKKSPGRQLAALSYPLFQTVRF